MSRPSTLTELALNFGILKDRVARTLGVTYEELHLLDCGCARVLDSDVPEVAKRIGSLCTTEDVQNVLVRLGANPPPRDLCQRIDRASSEFIVSGSMEPSRFLDEHFRDPFERRQVRGPNLMNQFEWHRALIRIKAPTQT